MLLTELTAISPLDGRYRRQLTPYAAFFSEFGLIKYRVWVEIAYLQALIRIPLPQLQGFPDNACEQLTQIYTSFTIEDALAIKQIEKTTNHDVKAVEYFLKQKLTQLGLEKWVEWVHFGLTSQDINNTATPLLLQHAITQLLLPQLNTLIEKLQTLGQTWANIPMLSRTHGQPASPTLLGKEILVFEQRLQQQKKMLLAIPYTAKFGGAVGNFNAHYVAFPIINWHDFAHNLLQSLGLTRTPLTTQIEPHDNLAAFCDALKRINTITIDLCRDVWTYISMDYFKQQIKSGEIGSSAMPHKVNPIDFENAEGNLGIANALLEHLSAKLPISRLQRDLTDSTVLRNLGVPIAQSHLAYANALKGLNKLMLNQTALNHDLANHWSVVAEAIQTILRREAFPEPYEALKNLTRKNEQITQQTIIDFIAELQVPEKIKHELLEISPFNYTGKMPDFN